MTTRSHILFNNGWSPDKGFMADGESGSALNMDFTTIGSASAIKPASLQLVQRSQAQHRCSVICFHLLPQLPCADDSPLRHLHSVPPIYLIFTVKIYWSWNQTHCNITLLLSTKCWREIQYFHADSLDDRFFFLLKVNKIMRGPLFFYDPSAKFVRRVFLMTPGTGEGEDRPLGGCDV